MLGLVIWTIFLFYNLNIDTPSEIIKCKVGCLYAWILNALQNKMIY